MLLKMWPGSKCRSVRARAVTLVAILACWAVGAFGQQTPHPVSVEVRRDPAHATRLLVELVSSAPDSVDVYESSLPWGNHYSMLLMAVGAESGVALERYWPIDDPGDKRVVLRPGEALSGGIDLTSRCAGLREALEKEDIVLFWSFRLKHRQDTNFERVGGWLLLPRTSRT
jgi:hypothetical protein